MPTLMAPSRTRAGRWLRCRSIGRSTTPGPEKPGDTSRWGTSIPRESQSSRSAEIEVGRDPPRIDPDVQGMRDAPRTSILEKGLVRPDRHAGWPARLGSGPSVSGRRAASLRFGVRPRRIVGHGTSYTIKGAGSPRHRPTRDRLPRCQTSRRMLSTVNGDDDASRIQSEISRLNSQSVAYSPAV